MTRVAEVELVESTGFCNWLDMTGEWGELSTETTYCGLFPLYGLLNNHLICFNLRSWREGCRSRRVSLALWPRLGGRLPLKPYSACEQTGGLGMISF